MRRSLDAGSRALPQVVGHLLEQRRRGRPKRRPIIPRSSGAMPSPAIAANSVVRLRGRAAASTSVQASEPALLARRSEPRARSSSGSRPGTTRAGCTRRSGTSHRTTTAIALGPGGDGEGSCLARRSPPKRGGPSCSARFLCHASACESARRATWNNGGRKLSCPLDGRTLKQSYVRHLVRRLADKAVVERRVHPHALRHTHSAEWLARAHP